MKITAKGQLWLNNEGCRSGVLVVIKGKKRHHKDLSPALTTYML